MSEKINFQKDKIPFTQVANAVLNDSELSARAKGMYAYLYSKPDGWDFSVYRIQKDHKESDKTIRKTLIELEERGYLTRMKQADGRMVYRIHFPPISQTVERANRLKKPNGRNGKRQKRQVADSTAISNKEAQVIKRVSNKELEKPVSPFVWETYLKGMEDHKRKDLQLIAYYFRQRNVAFDSKAEAEVAIRRHLRAATQVAKFSEEKVIKAIKVCEVQHKDIGWTLETVMKTLPK